MGCASSSSAGVDDRRTQRGSSQMVVQNPHNRRVKAVTPWQWEGPVSATQLSMKRQTFWEAQSAGRRIIWENLKVVAEAMLQQNIELANTLIDAADIRVPNGDLSVCYDSLGQLYQVPRYCYSNPSNLVSDEEAAALAAKSRKDHVGPVSQLQVTLRLSPSANNSEQDIKIEVASNTTVKDVKRLLHEKLQSGTCDQTADTSNTKPNKWIDRGLPPSRQRLIFRGRELPDGNHMQEAGVQTGAFLQIFVRPE